MNKQSFFNAVRRFVDENAVEPRTGFVANTLSVVVGNFEFAIEGRDHGTGYCTVREGGEVVASESPINGHMPEMINWRILMIVFGGSKPETPAHAHLADAAGNCAVCEREVA